MPKHYTMLLPVFNFIKQSVIDFILFVRSPKGYTTETIPAQQKIFASIVLLVLKFCFSILIAGLIGLFYEPKNLTDQSLSERFIPFLYLIIGGMVLPYLEEILFRLSLKFKPIYLISTSICIGYYVSTKFIFDSRLSSFDDTFMYRICIGLCTGILAFNLLRNKQFSEYLRKVWIQKFTFIYYISAIVFAWLHIFNFELNLVNILLLPFLTLPQLFSGLIMGYMRINFGFQYPLFFHMATNSLLVGLDILVK